MEANESQCDDTPDLEQCCINHNAGLPGAEQKLVKLGESLVQVHDPDEWGQAWMGFRDAVFEIGKPTFRPTHSYGHYIAGRMERAIRKASRADRMPFGPSKSYASKLKKKGKKIPGRQDAAWQEERATQRDKMKVALQDMELPERQERIVRLSLDGNSKKEVARQLGISAKTVSRELAEIRRTVSEGSALTLAV